MGDISQLKWIQQNNVLINGSVLELGARFYDTRTAINYRKALKYPGKYIGADISPGDNVDVIFDLTADINDIKKATGNELFQTVLCCSVMEHVKDIYKAAYNISNLLESKGVLFFSVPFSWEYHGYPNDYWRFTPNAIEFLFKDFDFPIKYRTVSSNYIQDIKPLEFDPNGFILRNEILQKNSKVKNSLLRKLYVLKDLFMDGEYRKERIIKCILGEEYRLIPGQINMVGIKK